MSYLETTPDAHPDYRQEKAARIGSFATDQEFRELSIACLLYTSPSPRDVEESRMPSSA